MKKIPTLFDRQFVDHKVVKVLPTVTEGLEADTLIPHGKDIIELDRSYEGIRDYLESHLIEGIVFWKDGKPMCKIKRKDFGFKWK